MNTNKSPRRLLLAGRLPHDQALERPGLDGRITRTVARLNSLCKSTKLKFTISVGELVLNELYGGDIGKLRSRNRKDHLALRRVAGDPSLAMSASTLYRSITIFDVCQRMHMLSWEHVSTSHVRAVLALDPRDQEELLALAERDRWSVRRLEQSAAEVAAARPPLAKRGGRKRRTRLSAVVGDVTKKTDEVAGLLSDEDPLRDSSPESIRDAIEAFERLRDICAAAVERVKGEATDV